MREDLSGPYPGFGLGALDPFHGYGSIACWPKTIDPPGYFCREPGLPTVKFAFTNYGVSIGLQAIRTWSERVHARQQFVAAYRSHDGYGRDAITHVMGCSSRVPGGCSAGTGG
jgi:hypothetical protein